MTSSIQPIIVYLLFELFDNMLIEFALWIYPWLIAWICLLPANETSHLMIHRWKPLDSFRSPRVTKEGKKEWKLVRQRSKGNGFVVYRVSCPARNFRFNSFGRNIDFLSPPPPHFGKTPSPVRVHKKSLRFKISRKQRGLSPIN